MIDTTAQNKDQTLTLPTPTFLPYVAGNGQTYQNPGAMAPVVREPAVISTQQGKDVLDAETAKHNAEMAALGKSQQPQTTDTPAPKVSDTTIQALKAQGGLTADEAKASGTDLTNYTYDTNSGYFMPKDGATQANETYKAETEKINSTFDKYMAGLDASTQALIESYKGLYADRMRAQQEVNAHEAAAYNTMNIRGGTDRYAGGVAQSIMTAEENAGLERIAAIGREEAAKIAEANQNLSEKKYTAFMDNRREVDELRKERNATIKDLNDRAYQQIKDKRDYDLNVQKFQETQKMDAFERAYKTEDLKIKRANSALGLDETGNPARQVVAISTNGTPVKADQEAFLAKLPPATATMVKSLTDYTMNPANLTTRQGQRQQILALAHQYDPTFNENNYTVAAKVKQEYTSGATAKNIQSLNTSVNHIGDLAVNFKNLPNGDITKFNTLKDWYSSNVGKGDVTKVVTDLNAVAGELAKTFKGTGATDQEVSAIERGINVNSSPAQFKAFIEETTKLLGGRLNALNDSYQTAVGKPFERNFLGADTQSKLSQLKNAGYNIEVPGVLYTDPKAYVKYDKSGAANLKAVISQYPNLSPEDALQLAQSL